MAVSLKHTFQSAKSDGSDGTLVQPSNWNAEHDLTLATSRVLGRITAGTGAAEELTGANVRTIAGLATSDSPQFTAIELGHVSDTTIARSSAGVITVEGNTVWHAGNDGAASGLDADLLDGKNTGTSGNVVPLLDGANTWSGQQTFSLGSAATTEPVRALNTTDNASVQVAQLEGDRATPAANDEAYVSFLLSDSVGNQDEFARITWRGTTVTNTSEAGRLGIGVVTGGSLADEVYLTGTNFYPASNDGNALGISGTAWADLFLADGGVINWNAGNATLTHSTSLLTSNVPISVGTSNAITAGTIELGHASDTTLSRSSAGVLAVEGTTVSLNSTSAVHTASTIELGHASDTTISRSAAGVLAVEGNVLKQVGKETIYIPAVAMIARTTNGAASGTVEMTTNKNMFATLDFDTTTQEFAQFSVRMPKSWNEGTVTAVFTWSHASTTTNFGVVWALEGVAISDDDAGDVAFGTAQQVADTGGTTNDIYITSATSAITIAGTPQAEDWVMFQVKRVPSDGSDTMAIDARLHGVTLYVTTDAANDA